MGDIMPATKAARACKGCTAEIVPGPRERNPKIWCSAACKTNFHRTGRRAPFPYVPSAERPAGCGHRSGHSGGRLAQLCRECRPEPKAPPARRDTCAECRVPIGGRKRIYCSKRCLSVAEGRARVADGRIRAYRKANAEKIREAQKARRPIRQCESCGTEWPTYRNARYCTTMCQYFGSAGHWPKSDLPVPAAPRDPIPCAWCGSSFHPANEPHVLCSNACRYAARAMRRRGRESTAGGTYTWAEVIGLHLLFDRRCAYCEETIDGQPDPDHVLALSRGGSNSLTNILPSCRPCNSDKRDLTLDEWEADRARRGLPARITSWTSDDARYRHLTMASPTTPPRSRLAAERHAA